MSKNGPLERRCRWFQLFCWFSVIFFSNQNHQQS